MDALMRRCQACWARNGTPDTPQRRAQGEENVRHHSIGLLLGLDLFVLLVIASCAGATVGPAPSPAMTTSASPAAQAVVWGRVPQQCS